MPASEARILANQRNAAKSTGPKTVEGKEKSRQNALKHGLTGAGVVMIAADATEVARRTVAFEEELVAIDEVEKALVRRAALNSVRMERGADQQAAALVEHVRQVEADFVAPEGVSDAEAAQLLSEAIRRAMFNPSKEATLARKYEAAAERGFYRALKELQKLDRAAEAAAPAPARREPMPPMGSFSEDDMTDEEFDALLAKLDVPIHPDRRNGPKPTRPRVGIDVPITIGRGR